MNEVLHRISLGTMTFGSQVDEHEAERIVMTCLERGVSHFDTANSYQDGDAERMLGRLLRKVDRGAYTISTKVGSPKLTLGQEAGLSPGAVEQAIDSSLARLGEQYVDIYLMHMPDPDVPLEASLEAFEKVVSAGKAHQIGASNYAAWQVTYLFMYAQQMGWGVPLWCQQMYNLLARRPETEYLPAASELGIQTMAYNPLAGGLWTGKYRESPTAGRRFERERYRQRYWNDANHRAVRLLCDLAAECDISLVELSLRWLLTNPGIDRIVLGVSTHAQLLENLDAVDEGPLDPEIIRGCDEVWRELRGVAPDYNR